MKKINAKVFCRNEERNRLAFYVAFNGSTYYLFTTSYFSNPVYDEYYNGKRLDTLFVRSSIERYQRLKERIIRMIKYIELEYDVILFSSKRNSLSSCNATMKKYVSFCNDETYICA